MANESKDGLRAVQYVAFHEAIDLGPKGVVSNLGGKSKGIVGLDIKAEVLWDERRRVLFVRTDPGTELVVPLEQVKQMRCER